MHARKMVQRVLHSLKPNRRRVLGILAAIVIPQFTNASEAAKASSVLSQLQTLRSQVELYKNQHNNEYPTVTTPGADWTKMTKTTSTVLLAPPLVPTSTVLTCSGTEEPIRCNCRHH